MSEARLSTHVDLSALAPDWVRVISRRSATQIREWLRKEFGPGVAEAVAPHVASGSADPSQAELFDALLHAVPVPEIAEALSSEEALLTNTTSEPIRVENYEPPDIDSLPIAGQVDQQDRDDEQ